jgi:hypothetical protein
MADIAIPRGELAAAVEALKAALDKYAPKMFRGLIKDDMISYMAWVGLEAAAQARFKAKLAEHVEKPEPRVADHSEVHAAAKEIVSAEQKS